MALAFGTAHAGAPLEIALQTSDLRDGPDGERLASVAVRLPTSLRDHRVDFATLEFWIDPTNEEADTIPFLVSVVPLEEDGEGGNIEVPGRWASAVVADPRAPRRIILDATRVLRYWVENPTAAHIFGVRVSQRQLLETPTISTSRLGTGIVARLRVYATRQTRKEPAADGR